MSSNDRVGPKGLKRLSLAPGARALPSPRTPNSASVTTEFPLPSPLDHARRHAPKRASSISYYNSAYTAPSPTSSSSGSFVRSPLPPTIHESASAFSDVREGLRRAASLPKRRHTALSIGNAIEKPPDVVIPAQTLSPPQTLAEKHADLLSFIAKKESKCMELREQLAQQEAELASLKRKWERIVSRAASNIPATVGSSSDTSPSPNARSKPLPATTGTEAVNEVVGVIRDGVTGLGRMLAMGSLGSPLAPPSQPASPASISTPVQRAVRPSSVQHSVLESSSRTSSVSSITVTSPPESTTSTGRTSLSSVTSLASEDADQGEPSSDALLLYGGHSPTLVIQRNWSNEREHSLNNSPTSSPAASKVQLDEPSVPSLQLRDRSTKTLSLGPSTPSSRGSFNLASRLTEKKALTRLTSPPVSSSSSSWVPTSLNKRLEGLQKSDAITKTSKRASMLLSDVAGASSSFLGSLTGALAPPTPTNSAPLGDSASQQIPAKYVPSMTTGSITKCDRLPSSPSILDEGNDDQSIQYIPRGPPAGGLIKLDPPLMPNKLMTTTGVKVSVSKANTNLLDDDDDEWNW